MKQILYDPEKKKKAYLEQKKNNNKHNRDEVNSFTFFSFLLTL